MSIPGVHGDSITKNGQNLILETVYVRHFRSFNFDFLRQGLTDQDRFPWDELVGTEDFEPEDGDNLSDVQDFGEVETESDDDDATTAGPADPANINSQGVSPTLAPPAEDAEMEEPEHGARPQHSYYPFVKVKLERDITTVVGANESGKSQLITAIQCLLGDHQIRPRDFCRYSKFFGVRRFMRLPEFGGHFTELTPAERSVLSSLTNRDIPNEFWFFRLQKGAFLYVKEENGSFSTVRVEDGDIGKLPLPTSRRIDSTVVLPSSASLFDLASGHPSPLPRSRDEWLTLFKLLKNIAEDSDNDPLTSSWVPKTKERQKLEAKRDRDSLELVRSLLESVAEVDSQAYTELLDADAEDDGYSSALTTSITEALDVSLNFQKWWSQDRDFSVRVHKDAFHLVFTLKDKTGQTYTFDERSGGMQYFLSYFIQREAYTRRNPDRSEILLMDEPDAYLSTLGQQDLMRVFTRYAFPDDGKPAAQVMYVTHSPFLIDKNYPHRIRVLQKGLGEEGTRIVQKAAIEKYEPLRSAFSSFHADTAFIGTCNLLVEGPADLILFSGISARMKREAIPRPTLDLNSLTMVPVHGAGNYRYLVHLTRGRDLDRPAIVVLLDSDKAGDRAGADLQKLENGFGEKPVLDQDLIFAVDNLPTKDLKVAVSEIHEPEDLVPAAVARDALVHFVSEYRSAENQKQILENLPDQLVIDAKKRLYDQARDALFEASTTTGAPLSIGKIEFAHAVSAVARTSGSSEALEDLFLNFGALFTELNRLQEEAMERHDRERITQITKRVVDRFKRDHKTRANKHTVTRLLDEIESHLNGSGAEDEAVRAACRSIRNNFGLEDSPLSNIENFADLKNQLSDLVLAPRRSADSASGR